MKDKRKDANTEELILTTAGRVFTQKGFAAARMEDIAQEAGINRALLHYYFRSKSKLFGIVFEHNLKKFYANFLEILAEDIPMKEKIGRLVDKEIDTLRSHPDLPLFIVNEVARDPSQLLERLKGAGPDKIFREFTTQFSTAFPNIDAHQFLLSLMSMCIFPFVGRPMLMAITRTSAAQFDRMMEQRKEFVTQLLLQSLEK